METEEGAPELHIRMPLNNRETEAIRRIIRTQAIGPGLQMVYMVRLVEQIKGAVWDAATDQAHEHPEDY